MKVTAFIRKNDTVKGNLTDKSTVYFRVRDEYCDIKAASELSINPNHWSAELQGYKSRVTLVSDEKKRTFNRKIQEISNLIGEKYYRGADGEWLKNLITEYHHPEIFKLGENITDTRLTTQIAEYIEKRRLAKHSHYTYNGIITKVQRYERYQREINHRKAFSLRVDTMTGDDLYKFKKFIVNEYSMVEKYPQLYKDTQHWRVPKDVLSENAVYDMFHRIRSVIKWCERNGIPTQHPFDRYEMQLPVYGTPWYLTIEERDRIFNLDLSDKSNQLNYHRDIFMFQCLVGCRMGDIPRMTRSNIIDGALEYIPHKTQEAHPRTVRVPLNEKARIILDRYKDRSTTLFPYFEDWMYNNSIRELCTMAGVTRMVSVIDVKTNREVQRPLNEIASSHMGRRTFIGNMYKQVKDPDLIGSMSGHVEGSKAFTRYRAIDDEMKIELVNLIN
jgi:site-specific recombinase XerD